MFRTLDIVMIAIMTAAATLTYSIKHQADLKLEVVRKLDAEIKLEEDTIDLLRADWALLTQPNRLNALVKTFEADLKLVPTESTQLVRPEEMPMLRADLPQPDAGKEDAVAKAIMSAAGTDAIKTGSVAR